MANSVTVNVTVLNELHTFTRFHARAGSDASHLWSSVHLALFLVPLALLNTSPLDNGTVNLTGLTFSYGLHR